MWINAVQSENSRVLIYSDSGTSNRENAGKRKSTPHLEKKQLNFAGYIPLHTDFVLMRGSADSQLQLSFTIYFNGIRSTKTVLCFSWYDIQDIVGPQVGAVPEFTFSELEVYVIRGLNRIPELFRQNILRYLKYRTKCD
ncbi:hypothetical protein CSKR_110734, partial [Clonorchis sinensis]